MNDDFAGQEPSVDSADMLRIMREQQRATQRRFLDPFVNLLFVWAVAWFVGFAALWSAQGIGGNPWLRIPLPAAWAVFGVLIVAAIAWSATVGVRAASGIRGASQISGALYGWSWTITMVGASLLLTALHRMGLPPDVVLVIYPAVFVFLVGVQYLAGGAMERSIAQYALGVVLVVTAVAATFAGPPIHFLIYALVAPTLMAVAGIVLRVRARRGAR